MDHSKLFAMTSFLIWFKPFLIALKSLDEMIFCFFNISACASEPAMSYTASLWSKFTDAVYLLTISLVGSENLSDQFCLLFFISTNFSIIFNELYMKIINHMINLTILAVIKS